MTEQEMTEPVYVLENVRRVFDASGRSPVVAVDNLSLTLEKGARLGIVVEAGSGKSTLIRMMAALDRPTSGTIRFHGRPIEGLPERRLGFLRAKVQMVFQDPRSSLNPRMTVGDIICEPLRSRLLRTRSDIPTDRGARLAKVLDAVGLPADSGKRYPHEFSGGQRQRIAIARALAPSPEVLIADEPVSALDVSVRAQVLNLLDHLVDDFGLTLVFVSHDLMVVRHICNEVLVMRRGKVEEAGPTEQVYAAPAAAYTAELLAAVPRIRLD